MEGLTTTGGNDLMKTVQDNWMILAVVVLLVLVLVWYVYFYAAEGMLPGSKPVLGATSGAPGLRFGSVKDDAYDTLWTPGNRAARSDTFFGGYMGDEGMKGNPRDAGHWSEMSLGYKAMTGN